LVQAVAGICLDVVAVARPLVAVVGPAVPGDFMRLVAVKRPGVVLGGAGEVVA
jgi:hypothetical protein